METPCCSTLFVLSRTQDDLRADPDVSAEMDIDTWAPLVEWSPPLRMFVIGNVAIGFCPWCGTKLTTPADPHPTPYAPDVQVTIGPAGEVFATLDGKPLDTARVTRLAPANEDETRPAPDAPL